MHKVMRTKSAKHSLAYEFLLNKVFDYFYVECGLRKDGLVKQMFILSTLEENECIHQRSEVKSKLVVVDLIEVQSRLTSVLEEMISYWHKKM